MNSSLEIKALRLALLAGAVSLGGTLLGAAPIKWMMRTAPVQGGMASAVERTSSPELIAQGREFFTMSCVECHGDDAHGDEGPDLHNLTLSNARIEATIKKGVKGEMPAFARKYDDAKVAALLAYLRSLR